MMIGKNDEKPIPATIAGKNRFDPADFADDGRRRVSTVRDGDPA
jgi:hypothetical protein